MINQYTADNTTRSRNMKIYTKQGDKGTSRLYSGELYTKSYTIFNSLGNADELNIRIGMLISMLEKTLYAHTRAGSQTISMLRRLQQDNIKLCSAIATTKKSRHYDTTRFDDANVSEIELLIDQATAQLPALSTFICVNDSPETCAVHLCRTACRAFERSLVKSSIEQFDADFSTELKYVNRLSDYFFQLGRVISHDTYVSYNTSHVKLCVVMFALFAMTTVMTMC